MTTAKEASQKATDTQRPKTPAAKNIKKPFTKLLFMTKTTNVGLRQNGLVEKLILLEVWNFVLWKWVWTVSHKVFSLLFLSKIWDLRKQLCVHTWGNNPFFFAAEHVSLLIVFLVTTKEQKNHQQLFLDTAYFFIKKLEQRFRLALIILKNKSPDAWIFLALQDEFEVSLYC